MRQKLFIIFSTFLALATSFVTGIFFQAIPPDALTDEEAFLEPSGTQSDCKTSVSTNNIDIISVNQLLESVRHIFIIHFLIKFIGYVPGLFS